MYICICHLETQTASKHKILKLLIQTCYLWIYTKILFEILKLLNSKYQICGMYRQLSDCIWHFLYDNNYMEAIKYHFTPDYLSKNKWRNLKKKSLVLCRLFLFKLLDLYIKVLYIRNNIKSMVINCIKNVSEYLSWMFLCIV